MLLIGGANDKLRGCAEGLPEGSRSGEAKGIVKLEAKRNETKRDGIFGAVVAAGSKRVLFASADLTRS